MIENFRKGGVGVMVTKKENLLMYSKARVEGRRSGRGCKGSLPNQMLDLCSKDRDSGGQRYVLLHWRWR